MADPTPDVRRTPPPDAVRCLTFPSVTIWEHPTVATIALRGDGEAVGLRQAIEAEFGCDLPLKPNTWCRGTDGVRISWLGPDHWHISLDQRDASGPILRLRAATEGLHVAFVEVSDTLRTTSLEGPGAPEVIAQGCPLDLAESLGRVHLCARSLLGPNAVLIHRMTDEPSFEVAYRASLGDYVWAWMARACENIDGR